MRMPVTVGLLRPVILLPADRRRWSPALLHSVVATSSRRRTARSSDATGDGIKSGVVFVHLLAWLLRRRLSALAEQCCDDAVLATLDCRGDYARHLLEIAGRLAKSRRRGGPWASRWPAPARWNRGSWRFSTSAGRWPGGSDAGRAGPGGDRRADRAVGRRPTGRRSAAIKTAGHGNKRASHRESRAAARPKPTSRRPRECCWAGVVAAADGAPLAGAEVRLKSVKADQAAFELLRGKSDGTGSFSFSRCPPGRVAAGHPR